MNIHRRKKIIFLIFLFLALMSSTLLAKQVFKQNNYNVSKKEYRYFIKNQDTGIYEPYTDTNLPDEGYFLNLQVTNSNCTQANIKQNEDLSINVLVNFSLLCNLYYDHKTKGLVTLEKLQEISNSWEQIETTPDFSTVSPITYITFSDDKFSGSTTTNNSAANRYFICSSTYEMNEENGKYSLTGNIRTIRLNSTTNANTLKNDCKYIVNYSGATSNPGTSIAESTYKNLDTIYQITNATYTNLIITASGTITYISSSNSEVNNANCQDCGVYKTKDDYGDSFYVRGEYQNNYVKFGKNANNQELYWRIVRINGDGSLRVIYAGTSPNAKSYISSSSFNSSTSDNAYIGYTYGDFTGNSTSYNEAHSNIRSSTLKNYLENWFSNNLSAYESELSDSVFCYDRSLSNGQGYGTENSYYGSYDRLYINKSPNIKCSNKNDKFTVNDTEVGNGKLSHPIGLLSRDEAAMAGLVNGQNNPTNYLYKGVGYWLGTPTYFNNSTAYMGIINKDGNINGVSVSSSSYYVVPVINISQNVVLEFIGAGTSTDPFRVNESRLVLEKLSSLNHDIALKTEKVNLEQKPTEEGIYSAKDDYGTSYYWRGNSTTNYIKFGNWYWRIVRINGDGSIRIIYDGADNSDEGPGYGGHVGKPDGSDFNEAGGNAAVGYMYGSTKSSSTYDETHANQNNSNLKNKNDSWYQTNISNQSFEQYISDTLFCNDRSIYIGTGIGNTETKYSAYYRLEIQTKPTLTCPQKNDKFTVSDTIIGNGALTYPIGAITADEALFAGLLPTTTSTTYLNRSNSIYTMTPERRTADDNSGIITIKGIRYIFTIGNRITNSYNTDPYTYSAPVINLKPEVADILTGAGTITDPFIVS